MRAVVEGRHGRSEDAPVGLIDKCGGLEGQAGAVAAHLVSGEAVQFAVHQGKQRIERCAIAFADAVEKQGDVGGGIHRY